MSKDKKEDRQRAYEELQEERRLLPSRLPVYLITSSILFLGFASLDILFVQRVLCGVGLATTIFAFLHFQTIASRLDNLVRMAKVAEKRKGWRKYFRARVMAWLWFPLGFLVIWGCSLSATILHWI